MLLLFWQIFSTFFVIGLFNFGGGGAMLSLIQAQVVSIHGWLSEGAFTDIVAISQTTPGPIGINCATYVGFEVFHSAGYGMAAGIIGSFAATLAVVLPSFLVFFFIMKLFTRFHEAPAFNATMTVLKPSVAGLIAAAALVLILDFNWGGEGPAVRVLTDNFPDWKAWLLFIAAFLLSYFNKIGPIKLILLSAAAGLLLY